MRGSGAAFSEFAAFSARLGGDPSIIQGAGGNTSLKTTEHGRRILHVKASGLWLSRATTQPSFVALDLDRLLERLAMATAEPALTDLVIDAPPGMRPSIETTLHSVMPHPVVVHTHSVNAIAHLIQGDSAASLTARLDGLRWTYVPYARPGLPLLRAVEAAQGPGADVLLLANHGLVFGAADLEQAGRMQDELERRLALPARTARAGDVETLRAIGAPFGWRPAALSEAHALGTDPVSFHLAGRGAYYPDHVVFLGAGPVQLGLDCTGAERLGKKLVLVKGAGALVPNSLADGAEEMVRCLALVLARVDAAARLTTLDPAAEHELTNWDAEAFRRTLAAVGAA